MLPLRYLFLVLIFIPALALAEQVRLFTAVIPLQVLAKHIGGKHVEVESLVSPGFDPHHYEPTPQQIQALSQAALYIQSDMPFEQAWIPRIRSTNQAMQVLDIVPAEHAEADHHPNEHGHAHADPHRWTSPVKAVGIATGIRDALGSLLPAYANEFARNHAQLSEQLKELDKELREQLDDLQQRHFLVFHPAWGHFAEAYGLEQVAIEHEGKQPGARALTRLIEQAREHEIRAILVQPQMDTRLAQRVAHEIGARVVEVDPLGADYPDNLSQLAHALAEASTDD